MVVLLLLWSQTWAQIVLLFSINSSRQMATCCLYTYHLAATVSVAEGFIVARLAKPHMDLVSIHSPIILLLRMDIHMVTQPFFANPNTSY